VTSYYGKLTSVRRVGGLGLLLSWSAGAGVTLPLIISTYAVADGTTISASGDTVTVSAYMGTETEGGGVA